MLEVLNDMWLIDEITRTLVSDDSYQLTSLTDGQS